MVQRPVLCAAELCPALWYKVGRQPAGGGRCVLFLAKPLDCFVTMGEPLLVSVVNMYVSFLSISQFECSKKSNTKQTS